MARDNIDNTGELPPGAVYPLTPQTPPDSVAPSSSTSSSTVAPASETSSIEPSSSQSQQHAPDSAMPILDEPSAVDFEALHRLSMQKIANEMLDKWLDSIEEQGRRVREELRSAQYLAWLKLHSPDYFAEVERKADRISGESAAMSSPDYLAWVATLGPSDRDYQRQYEDRVGLQVETIQSVGNFVGRVRDGEISMSSAVPLAAASFVLGITSTGEMLTTAELGQAADMNASTYKEMWNHVGNNLPEIRPDILGLLGAMMMVQFTAQATVNTIADPAGDAGGKPNKKFAEEYAKTVIQMVTGKDLDNAGGAMLSGKADNPSAGVTVLKISFLATALALLYKNEAGKITGDEFAGMLSGEIPLEKGDLKATLAGLIRSSLGQLPGDMRLTLVNNLLAYMDTNPKVEQKMAEASKMYSGLMRGMSNPAPLEG